uniref:Uncharacterized protein n=1 Tax=viral metagenome TaxID=1070528 RepID=A0A6C0BMD9_9ZZZZ
MSSEVSTHIERLIKVCISTLDKHSGLAILSEKEVAMSAGVNSYYALFTTTRAQRHNDFISVFNQHANALSADAHNLLSQTDVYVCPQDGCVLDISNIYRTACFIRSSIESRITNFTPDVLKTVPEVLYADAILLHLYRIGSSTQQPPVKDTFDHLINVTTDKIKNYGRKTQQPSQRQGEPLEILNDTTMIKTIIGYATDLLSNSGITPDANSEGITEKVQAVLQNSAVTDTINKVGKDMETGGVNPQSMIDTIIGLFKNEDFRRDLGISNGLPITQDASTSQSS